MPSKTWGVLPREIQLVIANQLIKDAVDYINQHVISHTIKAHTGRIFFVGFNHDGSRIVSGAWDETIKIWNAYNGQWIKTFQIDSPVFSVAFSPDGSRAVSGAEDGNIKIWDVDNVQLIHTFDHGIWVNSVAFSPDGSRIVSGAQDGTIKIWDFQIKRKQQVFNWFEHNLRPDQAVIIKRAYETKLLGKKLALKGGGLIRFNKMPYYVRSLLIDYLDIILLESKSKSD